MRISQVRLGNFRGITDEIAIDLSNAGKSKAASLLLLGDNGTGKSSIIDAIEFGLLGRGARLAGTSISHSIYRLRNATVPEGRTSVKMTLSDGVVHERLLVANDSGEFAPSPAGPIQPFFDSGLVLRRDDLINFLRADLRQRASIFAAFTRGIVELGEPAVDSSLIAQAEADLSRAVADQRAGASEVARLIGVPAHWLRSADERQLDSVLVEHGWVRKAVERKRRGRLTAQEVAVFEAVAELRRQFPKVRRAREVLTTATRTESLAKVTRLLDEVGDSLTDSLKKVSPAAYPITAIHADLGEVGNPQVALRVELDSGYLIRAEDYFSEANLDLLALLLFLVLIEKAADRGQPKVLILDDVLQSIDSTIRLHVAEYLLTRFAAWQLILTFHDRLWYEEFRALCATHGHPVVERQISGWSHQAGPKVVQVARDVSQHLRDVVDSAIPQVICGQAGFLLETMSDWLSKSLGTSVTRRHGDKYTLGDTWPGVQKVLCEYETSDAARHVGNASFLRNVAGAHFNEWAMALSLAEARDLAERVIQVWDLVWCSQCRSTVSRSSSKSNFIACKCGQLSIDRL